MKVEDIYNGVRRFDPALASAWEPYLGLDIGNQERQTGARKEFGSISFEFFQNLMEESNSARGQDSIGSVVDLDAVATEVRLDVLHCLYCMQCICYARIRITCKISTDKSPLLRYHVG